MSKVKIYFDGICLNNGQPNAKAGCGIAVQKDGKWVMTDHIPFTEGRTNNEAEWKALEWALFIAGKANSKPGDIEVLGDSQLVIKQLYGEYKVSEKFKAVHERCRAMMGNVSEVTWIPREQNEKADEMSKLAVGIKPADEVTVTLLKDEHKYLLEYVGKDIGFWKKRGDEDKVNRAKEVYAKLKMAE